MTGPLVSRTTWTVEDNKRQMQVSDDAFNAKDLARCNHADDAAIHMPGGVDLDMDAHMADAIAHYAAFPDIRVHNHDYKIVFGEGEWIIAVADVLGTNTGPLRDSGGAWLPPTLKTITFEVFTTAHWVNGLIVEEFIWYDTLHMMRQLRPAGTPVGLDLSHALEMTPLTPLHSGQSESPQENKQRMKAFHDAINARKLGRADLPFAPDAVVYGAADEPIGFDAYLADAERILAAFPDLRVHNDPYRVIVAEGDWTGTVSRMTGTHTGSLTSPARFGIPAVPATNKAFDLNYFTVARWQHGRIAQLKVIFDWVGVFQQLGLS